MIINADARQIPLADESVHCVITSPPYYQLRDYKVDGIGNESSLNRYLESLVYVFREVKRVLHPRGTLWLNIADTYAGSSMTGGTNSLEKSPRRQARQFKGVKKDENFKSKDMMMIPHRLAIKLQEDGWWVRQDIVWHKPNPKPGSITDRCTTAHEFVFLMAKSRIYHCDMKAIQEVAAYDGRHDMDHHGSEKYGPRGVDVEIGSHSDSPRSRWPVVENGTPMRNKRSVWTIATQPLKINHYAAFPEALVEPMILAGCPKDGLVLDPFCGSGTVGIVARKHGRRFIGLDLNLDYLEEMALPRAELKQTDKSLAQLPMFGGDLKS